MKPTTMATVCILATSSFAVFASESYGRGGTPRQDLSPELAVLTDRGIPPTRARQALRLQQRVIATPLVRQIGAALGSKFAGVWFEPAAAKLHVGVTSHASTKAVERLAARVGLAPDVIATPVRSTWNELLTAQSQWARRLARLIASGDARTGIDTSHNAVSIILTSLVSLSERDALRKAAAAAKVNIVVTVESPTQPRLTPSARKTCERSFTPGRAYCEEAITAGVGIVAEGANCTAGPMLIEQDETWLLTAGHCLGGETAGEGFLATSVKSAFLNGVLKEIGKEGTRYKNIDRDMAEVRVVPEAERGAFAEPLPTPVPALMAEWGKELSTTPHTVAGLWESEITVGLIVCHEGSASGERCGEVLGINVEGNRLKHLIETTACGEGGDSGGPHFVRRAEGLILMVGIHVQDTKACPGTNPRSVFEPFIGLKGAEEFGILSTFSKQKLLTTANEVRTRSVEILTSARIRSEKVKITGRTSTTTQLEILGSSTIVKCPEIVIETEQEGKTLLGLFHFLWQRCTTNVGGTCTGLGDESGSVLALGKYHLVEDKLLSEGSLGLGILFLLEHIHFSCTVFIVTDLFLVLGEVLCLISPLTLGTRIRIRCESSSGDPRETVYWNEKGEKVEMGGGGLKVAENEGREEMAAENGEAEGAASQEIELMD